MSVVDIQKPQGESTAAASTRQQFPERLDRLFDRFVSGFGLPDLARMFGRTGLGEGPLPGFAPVVDLTETEGSYAITAELPGLDAKDVEVTASGGLLTLKGEKRQQFEKTVDNTHISERSYGAFRRSFRIPDGVKEDAISASFANGVLKIELPKTNEAQQKKTIEIKTGT